MSITRINTNFDAIFSANALKQTERALQTAMARISTGKRINYASDDPMGVGMLTQFKSTLSGTRVAQQNIQEGIAMLQFADGVVGSFEDKLIQLKDIALRAGNSATLSSDQVTALNNEFDTIKDSMSKTTMDAIKWNGKAIAAAATSAYSFQIGPQKGDTVAFAARSSLEVNWLRQGGVAGSFSGLGVLNTISANAALSMTAVALNNVGTVRSSIGRMMERMQYAIEDLMAQETNFAAAVSTVGDADLAAEISKMTTSQILAQSGAAMLGQANIHAQTLLNILM